AREFLQNGSHRGGCFRGVFAKAFGAQRVERSLSACAQACERDKCPQSERPPCRGTEHCGPTKDGGWEQVVHVMIIRDGTPVPQGGCRTVACGPRRCRL